MSKKHHDTTEPSPCYVCGNYGTNLQPLGCDTFRHHDCAPGSERWKDYMRAKRGKRSDVAKILLES